MAYMDDQAIERERTRQKILEGKAPLLGDDTATALHALGVNLGVVPRGTPPSQTLELLHNLVKGPKGVDVKDTPALQAPMLAPGRTPSTTHGVWKNDGELGSVLSGLFGNAKGSALKQYLEQNKAAQQANGAKIADHVRKGRAAPIAPPMGAEGGPAASDAIPGLKPGFDASKLPPGSPAAVAYMHENAPGGAVRGYEKGSTAPGDVEIHQAYGPGDKYGNAPPKPFTSIVTHWTGGDSLESALNTAKSGDPSRGGGRFGYHYYIDKDGKVYQGAPLDARTNHVKGPGAGQRSDRPDISNSNAIGISTVGSGEPNEAQRASAAKLIPQLQRQFNIKQENIVGHGQIQAGDRHKDEGQSIIKAARDAPPPGPSTPAWDKGLPAQADPRTNWPSPTETTPADKLTAEPPKGVGPQSSLETKGTSGSTEFSSQSRTRPADTKVANAPAASLVPSELLPGGQASAGGGGALADQRAPYKAIADANPSVRETMAAIMIAEDGSAAGRQGVAEAMMNRVNSRGEPFAKAMDPAYHADYMVKDPAKFQSRLAEIRNNPQLKAEMYALQDKAFAGSNITNLATDYASGGTAAKSRTNSTPTFTSEGGSQFFRKDIRPDEHGPDNVRNIQEWHKKTEAALKNPQTQVAQAPTANPKDVGSATSTMRDAVSGYLAEKGVPGSGGAGTVSQPAERGPTAAQPASVFDKGASAVPVAGVGGLQDPANEVATTATTLYDEGAAKLNEIKPPQAVAPPPAAQAAQAPPSATAPPPAAAAVMTPPPAPPPRAAAPPPPPAPPPAPVNPAHAVLDGRVSALAQKIMPGMAAFLPDKYGSQTARALLTNPELKDTIGPYLTKENLSKAGITPQQLQDAIKEGPPKNLGKRSDLGTSGATDISAQSRQGGVQNVGLFDAIKERLSPTPSITSEQFKNMNTPAESASTRAIQSNMPELDRFEYGGRDVPAPMPVINPADPRSGTEVARVPFGTPDYPLRELNSGQSSVRYGPPGVRGEGQRQLGERLGMDRKPNFDVGSQPAVQNADGSISTVRTLGFNDGGKEVNVPSVPAEGGRIMSNEEAFQRYKDTGRHLGKYDTVDQANAAAEALHQQEALQQSQHPQGQQPTVPPELAKAFEFAFKDESRAPSMTPVPPEAMPVLPSQVAPPAQNPGGGGASGLSLAPSGLASLPTGGFTPGAPASQGGSIAMAGTLPAIETSTFSTPLLDTTATGSPFGASSLSPIPFNTLNNWGWGGMGSGFSGGGGFDFGGGGGGGFDFGGGLGGGMMMPMSFGAGG